jgi:hypothetical protein
MTIADVRPLSRGLSLSAVVVLLPSALALIGLALRFLAFTTVYPGAGLGDFAQGLCRWDCAWYERIATSGYDPFPVPVMIAAGNWAFFPLYPMLVGQVVALTGLPVMTIATALSVLISAAAVIAAWPLLGGSLRGYALYAAFVLAGPFSVYFTTFYTEAPFLLLTTLGILALRRGRYLSAGVLGALMSATRIVGVFFVFAIAVQAVVDHRRAGGSLAGFITSIWKRPDLLLALFVAPLGLFVYMAFLNAHVGDALAFSHVQRAWARVVGDPVLFLIQALGEAPPEGWLPSVRQQLALASLAGLALCAVLAWRRRFAEALFCALALIVPLAAGVSSMLRFTVTLAPLPALVCAFLGRWWTTTAVTLCLFLATDYLFTIGWLREYLTLV